MPNSRLVNAALCNHSCHWATVRLRRPPELYCCALQCTVAYTADDMPLGGHLLRDYRDYGCSRVGNGAFSVDTAHSIALCHAGVCTVRCCCSGLEPCPLNRWFCFYPGDPVF
jgi:hypothetical protein